MMVNKTVKNFITSALIVAGGFGLANDANAQDSQQDSTLNMEVVKELSEDRGVYSTIEEQVAKYNNADNSNTIDLGTAKQFYHSILKHANTKVADTTLRTGEDGRITYNTDMKKEGSRKMSLLEEKTCPAEIRNLKGLEVAVNEDGLISYTQDKNIKIPEGDTAYIDIAQQGLFALMSPRQDKAPDSSKLKIDKEEKEGRGNLAVEAGVYSADGENAPMGGLSYRIAGSEDSKWNLGLGAQGYLGAKTTSDISDVEKTVKDPYTIGTGDQVQERYETTYTGVENEQDIANLYLTASRNVGKGIYVGVGPAVNFTHRGVTDQKEQTELNVYARSGPNASWTQTGYEQNPPEPSSHFDEKNGTSVTPGLRLELGKDNLGLTGTYFFDKNASNSFSLGVKYSFNNDSD